MPQNIHTPRWATLTATFLGVGYLKPGPGTWGSVAAVALWWVFSHVLVVKGFTVNGNWLAFAPALLAGFFILVGIPAATQVCRGSGIKDPQFVVIDEVAGQLITLVGVPVSWKSLLLGFILFRGFDIVKPPPVRLLERLPEGTGIVIDDVGAGLYALVIMQVLLHFRLLAG